MKFKSVDSPCLICPELTSLVSPFPISAMHYALVQWPSLRYLKQQDRIFHLKPSYINFSD